jgi:hypothetical protein
LPAESQDLVTIIHGTIKKIGENIKATVAKTADGTEHTIKVTDQATVHGTKGSFDDLREGSEVVAGYTAKGAEKTADEFGEVGKNESYQRYDDQDRQRHKDCRGQVR